LAEQTIPQATRIESLSLDAQDDTQLMRIPAGMKSEQAIALFSKDRNVEFAQPNYRLSALDTEPVNDPQANEQWHLSALHTYDAWKVSQGKDIVVAVLDTGVDANHPDLAGQVIGGPDYAEKKNSMDVFGHGTHVAGLIAAKANNGVGVCGMAPQAKVLAIKVLDKDGQGSIFNIAKGIKYAADYGAKNHCKVVINLSLGGNSSFDPINWAAGWYASRRGALLVAAAGNTNSSVGSPANLKYFIAVSASDKQDNKATFSCYGKQVAIAAPGTNMLSTMPTYHVTLNNKGYSQQYAAMQGTSMATPVVSGIAALLWSHHPDWKAEQVRAALEKSVVDIGAPGRDEYFGFGRIDALKAVEI
jgi:thermitase